MNRIMIMMLVFLPLLVGSNAAHADGLGSASAAVIEVNDPPRKLEIDRVFFVEIEVLGVTIKVKVTTCKQGTSGCEPS